MDRPFKYDSPQFDQLCNMENGWIDFTINQKRGRWYGLALITLTQPETSFICWRLRDYFYPFDDHPSFFPPLLDLLSTLVVEIKLRMHGLIQLDERPSQSITENHSHHCYPDQKAKALLPCFHLLC